MHLGELQCKTKLFKISHVSIKDRYRFKKVALLVSRCFRELLMRHLLMLMRLRVKIASIPQKPCRHRALIGARLGASCQGLIIFPRVRRLVRLARETKNINVFTLTVSHLYRRWYRRWRRYFYVLARNERWTPSMRNCIVAQPLDISRFLVNHQSFVCI